MEATGYYHYKLAYYLQEEGFKEPLVCQTFYPDEIIKNKDR